MPTNTAGTTARYGNIQQVHYLSADFNVADVDVSGGITKTLGVIPAGSVVIQPMSGISVHVAFDDTTVVDIGTTGTADLWATDLVTTNLGFVPCDVAANYKVYVDTTVTAKFVPAGTSVTVGSATAIICYIPANEAQRWLGAQS